MNGARTEMPTVGVDCQALFMGRTWHRPSPHLTRGTRCLSRPIARLAVCLFLLTNLLIFDVLGPVWAQVPTNITSSGLATVAMPDVNDPTIVNITGGTRQGTNLFHSFGQFNVGAGDTAMFQNTPSVPATTNILSRITGGAPSSIFGTVDTATHFPGANLFLINPAGIVFGSGATLNVGASAHFTTADYLRTADPTGGNAGIFHADPVMISVLTSAPVAAFGFLETTPSPISVNGSTLSVTEGHSISLVSGDITIGSGLNAPGAEIRLASVASAGEVLQSNFDSVSNINGESFTGMGTISLLQDSILEVSSDAAGTIIIRGGQLMMSNATISANTGDANGAATAVDIDLTGDLSIETDLNPAILVRSTSSGDAGNVHIFSQNMDVLIREGSFFFGPVIDSVTLGTGQAGSVNITTGVLEVTGDPFGFAFFIDSGNAGDGLGGDVTITADNFTMKHAFLNTGDNFNFRPFPPIGPAGNLTIFADVLDFTSAGILTQSFASEGGNVTITAGDITLNSAPIGATGFTQGGEIIFDVSNSFVALDTRIESVTIFGPGPGAGITVNSDVFELTQGSQLLTTTLGNGDAGSIHVTTTNRVGLLGNLALFRPSGIFSNSFGALGSLGKAGSIFINTPQLILTDGGRINTATASSGLGGDVTVNADSISISGQQPVAPLQPIFGLGNQLASGIFTSTLGDGSACSGPCGNAGHVTITTGSLTLEDGARLDSGSSSTGAGGPITVNASGHVSISGTLIDGTPGGIFSRTIGSDPGSGKGGNITITAGQNVELTNNATVSAQSLGPSDAGNIRIEAVDTVRLVNSTVTTSAEEAEGGNIELKAEDLIHLVDSEITSRVQQGSGSAGSINLDPQFVAIQNSNILSTAVFGDGGPITITADLSILVDPFSNLDASSQFGGSGTVDIQAPIQNLSGTIAPLPQTPLQVANLFTDRCAAVKGGKFSSFVIGGRDNIPPEPGNFLSSPLLLENDVNKRPFESEQPRSHLGSMRLKVGEIPETRYWTTYQKVMTDLFPKGCSPS